MVKNMSALGYAFQGKNPGGIGAALHALMLVVSTARRHSQPYGIVADSLEWGLLNGYDSECPEPKNWLSYFTNPQTIPRSEVETVWVNCRGFYYEVPEWYPGTQFEWYSEILRELFQFQPEVATEVEKRVEMSGFQNTDAIVHIRRTDKILESPDIPLEKYLEACLQTIPKGTRVFVCSDLISIQKEFQAMLEKEGYPSTRDESEKESVQATRLADGGPYLESWEENLNAFKLLVMFSRASYLIGARASYLFRCGELLNLNILADSSKCVSLEDNLKLGMAPYVNRDDRSFLKSKPFSIQFDLTNPTDTGGVQVFKNFIPNNSRSEMIGEMKNFKKDWLPSPSWAPTMHRSGRDIKHITRCTCFACRTLLALYQSEIWNKLGGQGIDPVCVSYWEGNSQPLTSRRGKYLILFCSPSWSMEDGGLLHLVEKGEIIRTIVPRFGMLVLLENSEFFISRVNRSTPHFMQTLITFQSLLV